MRVWGARVWGARVWGARVWGARVWGGGGFEALASRVELDN